MSALSLRTAPTWRKEPWRVFFPLGLLLGFWGTLPWLAHAFGAGRQFPGLFHSVVQFEAFLTCFATGFLFTFVPRRTATAAPSTVEAGLAFVAPIALTVLAWRQQFFASTAVWLLLVTTLAVFLLRRVRAADRAHAAPAPFALLGMGLLFAFAGGVMLLLSGYVRGQSWWLHGLGLSLVTQGLFLNLVMGVGQAVLPAFLHARPPVKGFLRGRALAAQAAFGTALLASFLVEWFVEPRAGWALRAWVLTWVLGRAAGLWRPPTNPGLHYRLLWVSVWLLPVGCVLVALWPHHRVAFAHVLFLALGLMVLAFSTHMVVGRPGTAQRLLGRPWPVALFGALMLGTTVARVLVNLDAARYSLWLATAAAGFVAAGAVWFLWLSPMLLEPATTPAGGGPSSPGGSPPRSPG